MLSVYSKCVKKINGILASRYKSADDDLIKKVLEGIDDEFADLPAEILPYIETAALRGVGDGQLQLQIGNHDLIAKLNAQARDFAKDRAAELIGMKWVGDDLVENPDAQWVITDTVRDQIKGIISNAFEDETDLSDLSQQIQQASGFSDGRADVIAQTETMNAQIQSQLSVWKGSGLVEAVRLLVSADEGLCEECEAVAELGAVPIDEMDEDDIPPIHPNCRCVLVAETLKGDKDSEDDSDGSDDDSGSDDSDGSEDDSGDE